MQAHGVCRVDRAGLELVRELGEDRTIAGDRFNHLAAGEERRHGVQQFFTSVENADAHGAVDLVAGEGEEIRVQRLHVHRNVRRALRAVDDQHRAGAVRHAPRARGWDSRGLRRSKRACRRRSSFSVGDERLRPYLSPALPSVSHSINLSVAPVWRQTICQGRRLLWCSMMETSTSSPGLHVGEAVAVGH